MAKSLNPVSNEEALMFIFEAGLLLPFKAIRGTYRLTSGKSGESSIGFARRRKMFGEIGTKRDFSKTIDFAQGHKNWNRSTVRSKNLIKSIQDAGDKFDQDPQCTEPIALWILLNQESRGFLSAARPNTPEGEHSLGQIFADHVVNSIDGSKGNKIGSAQHKTLCKYKHFLRGAPMSGANLDGINLDKRFLKKRANLMYSDLSGASLRGAKLRKVNMRCTYLNNSDMRNAEMQGANLKRAIMEHANLNLADCSGANLCKANLLCTSFKGANLENARLFGANLKGANFQNTVSATSYGSTMIHQTNLKCANLRKANLEGAQFGDADLTGAKFGGADLRGCDIHKNKNIHGACFLNAKMTLHQSQCIIENMRKSGMSEDEIRLNMLDVKIYSDSTNRRVLGEVRSQGTGAIGRNVRICELGSVRSYFRTAVVKGVESLTRSNKSLTGSNNGCCDMKAAEDELPILP